MNNSSLICSSQSLYWNLKLYSYTIKISAGLENQLVLLQAAAYCLQQTGLTLQGEFI